MLHVYKLFCTLEHLPIGNYSISLICENTPTEQWIGIADRRNLSFF